MRPSGNHPLGPAGDDRRPRRAAPHPLPSRGARVRSRNRRPCGRDPLRIGSRRCRGPRSHGHLHRERQLRASSRRHPRRDGDQPGQPRAESRRGIPRVLPGNTTESPYPMTVMFLLALRLGRWGIAGFGAIAFLVTLLQAAGFYRIAGDTEAERQAFGRSMSIVATQFTVIIAPPIRPDTVGGYVQWRAFGFLAILFASWGLASASGAARGDEERGIVQAMLVGGLSRPRMIAARVAAFATGCMVAAVAASAGLLLAVASAGEMISPVAALHAAVAVAALGESCHALTLLFAQFTSARNSTAFG